MKCEYFLRGGPFIVKTGASLEGIGFLLLQEDDNGEKRIVECASKKFTTTQ